MSKNVIHDTFRLFNLQKFIASLDSGTGNNKLYLGIGRPQQWPGGDIEPSAMNTIDNRNSDWEDVCSLQRITTADVITAAVNEQWKANQKYDQYRHDWGKLNSSDIPERASVYYTTTTYPASIFEAKYYVVNSNNDVFICIKQAFDGSGNVVASTFEPGFETTGVYISPIDTGAGIFKANDGYYWKYIANIANDRLKFGASGYVPIRKLTVAPSSTSSSYNQWLSQESSADFKRGIYAINVTTKGTGYNGGVAGTTDQTSPTFKIVGNGTGIEFTVTYGAGGTVENIEITNPGSGYTFAEVVSTTGSGAVFDIIFSSDYGIGTDPIRDLSAIYLMINTVLDGDTGGLFVDNDYRKVMLVVNPKQYGSTSDCTALQVNSYTTLNISGGNAGSFSADQVITGSSTGAKAFVVQWKDSTGELRVIKNRDTFTSQVDYDKAALSITTSDTVGGLSISSITSPTVEPFSGDVIYSEYRQALPRASGNQEELNLIVQF